MGQDHHHHHTRNARKLALAAGLTGAFMLAEVAGGLISGSLALIADAGHMLTDFASLLLAWLAVRVAQRPADWQRTYGFDRVSVLAAFVNGLALFVIAAWITIEAIGRLRHPVEVLGGVMFWVAVAGLAVNVIAFLILNDGKDGNLNVRAAALHVAGDILGSIAAIVASLVILWTGWTPIDPILSVLVSVLILGAAWRVVRDSGRILLEAAPPGLDRRDVARSLTEIEGVVSVDHIHAWSVSEERPMVTMELRTDPARPAEAVKAAVRERLHKRYGINHVTIEIVGPDAAA